MGIMRVQVTFPRDTGLPEDVVVNTWHFNSFPMTSGEAEEAFAQLHAFYFEVPTGAGAALSEVLSSNLASPVTMKAYDLAHPAPRVPILTEDFTFASAADALLPDETAIVLSYHGTYESGTPNARRRGRVFLGPLNVNAVETVGGFVRPDADTRDIIVKAATDLMQAGITAVSPRWCVYSEADNDVSNVIGGWVDNALDTIRSRGPRATSRNTFAVA